MATKQAFVSPYNDEPVPQSIHLRIKGLREVPGSPGVFELQGVKPRIVDHDALALALGYESGSDPELEDKVLAAVWRFDMIRLLTDRIEI